MGVRSRLNELKSLIDSENAEQIKKAIENLSKDFAKATKLPDFYQLPFNIIEEVVKSFSEQLRNYNIDLDDINIAHSIQRLFTELGKLNVAHAPILLNSIYVPDSVSFEDRIKIIGSIESSMFCKEIKKIYFPEDDDNGFDDHPEYENGILERDHEAEENEIRKVADIDKALRAGQYETVLYLSERMGINFAQEENIKYLFNAIEGRNPRVVEFIISKGANVNAYYDNMCPIHKSFITDFELVKLLLNHGADINALDIYHNTVLHLAVDDKAGENVDYLLKHGAKTNIQNIFGLTPLLIASLKGFYRIAKHLLKNSANPLLVDIKRSSPLHFACARMDFKMVSILLKFGANPNTFNSSRLSPLHILLSCQNPKPVYETLFKNTMFNIVKEILDHGGNPNLIDSLGITPLHLACMNNLREVARLLIERGADKTARTLYSATPPQLSKSKDIKELFK